MSWMMAMMLAVASAAGADRVAGPGAALADTEAAAATFSSRLTPPPPAIPAAETSRPTLATGKTRIEFESTPVKDILDYLATVGKLNIVYDKALADAGIDLAAARVSIRVTGLTFEQVIGLVLPSGCSYLVQPNYVLITTAEKARATLTTRMYEVRDLM
jgi:hypothetical protein